MQKIHIERDYNLDFKFMGEIVAVTPKLGLYKTRSEKYVCATEWNELKDAVICRTIPEVVNHLGYSREAKELYRKAAIVYWINI